MKAVMYDCRFLFSAPEVLSASAGLTMRSKFSLTRDLVNLLPDRVDERGPVRWQPPGDDYYHRTVADIMAKVKADEGLWVFAIGSLIWQQRFAVTDTRAAIIRGWHRAFCLGPDTRHRGNPAAPGLMMSLDRGGQCKGVAFRMDPAGLPKSLEDLLRTEPPTPPSWVNAKADQGTVPAIAFTIERSHFMYAGRLSDEEVADRLASAVGHVGSMADYLLNSITHLEAAGIHDRYLWRMQAMVADRLARRSAG